MKKQSQVQTDLIKRLRTEVYKAFKRYGWTRVEAEGALLLLCLPQNKGRTIDPGLLEALTPLRRVVCALMDVTWERENGRSS
ncbi:MAG: hypothetical protein LHW45_08050 [Candidatus Cloacimonetes bacterium]|nr:hypothetical protein [Candidatus Cloacimonadota bacterium]MDY0367561.1 hypothetical protein [Candidatus Syntrophosphaera sp.]